MIYLMYLISIVTNQRMFMPIIWKSKMKQYDSNLIMM